MRIVQKQDSLHSFHTLDPQPRHRFPTLFFGLFLSGAVCAFFFFFISPRCVLHTPRAKNNQERRCRRCSKHKARRGGRIQLRVPRPWKEAAQPQSAVIDDPTTCPIVIAYKNTTTIISVTCLENNLSVTHTLSTICTHAMRRDCRSKRYTTSSL